MRILLLTLLLSGCVSPSQVMVDGNGHFVRCAAGGFGIFGAPLAYRSVSTCVEDMERVSYRKTKE